MFDQEFYPTPLEVALKMLEGIEIKGKNVLEPSAGKGDLIKVIKRNFPKEVYSYEKNKDLAGIVSRISNYKGNDFLVSEKQDLSHIDIVIMNPPFSNAVDHILHAYKTTADGTEIIALMNFDNFYTDNKKIKELGEILDKKGNSLENLGDCFSQAERKTGVNVGLVRIKKPGEKPKDEFADFFTDEDDDVEAQGNGLIQYNYCRDIVSRYIHTIKLYDKQLEIAEQIQENTKDIWHKTNQNKEMLIDMYQGIENTREKFVKELQKQSWRWIFEKMNLNKFLTNKIYEQLNRHIEEYSHKKFTMKNIYNLVDVLIQTQGKRMKEALIESFNYITKHYHENRHNVEGWKTNDNYMVGKKFILPFLAKEGWNGYLEGVYGYSDKNLEDFMKSICYCLGKDYNNTMTLRETMHEVKPQSGDKFDFEIFECKAYKKGSVHFKFKNEDEWAIFNKKVAEARGLQLPEGVFNK